MAQHETKFDLFDSVEDVVTHFKGEISAVNIGSSRGAIMYLVTARQLEAGKVVEEWFNEERLEKIEPIEPDEVF